MLLDTGHERKALRDVVTSVTPLARHLRVNLWLKHFALTGGGNEVVKPASEMSQLIEKPASEAAISTIRQLSLSNARTYHATFGFIPWSQVQQSEGKRVGASLWPVCPQKSSAEIAAKLMKKMPFDERFWTTDEIIFSKPKGLKGYFMALPVYWTIDENNHPGEMNVMLLSQIVPRIEEFKNA